MAQVGIFFGTNTGKTRKVAKMIKKKNGVLYQVNMIFSGYQHTVLCFKNQASFSA